jgi:hypothetical protein
MHYPQFRDGLLTSRRRKRSMPSCWLKK